MQESQIVGLFAIAAGAFAITASIMDWDWFMNSRKAQAWVKRIGRKNARGMYASIGAFVALFGLFMVIVAPGGDKAATTAQTDNTTPQTDPQAGSPRGTVTNSPQSRPGAPDPSQNSFDFYGSPETTPSTRNSAPAQSDTPAPSLNRPAAPSNRGTPNSPPDTGIASSTPQPPARAPASPDPTPETTQPDLPENAVNLLPLIDPARDKLHARWSKDGENLISPQARPAILQVPIELPDSYTITAVVEELEVAGNGSFGLGVNVAGSGVSVVIAGTKGDTSGLQLVDNKITRVNPTHRRGPVMRPGRNQIVCTVDRNRVQVKCNDEVIIDWDDDPSRLSYGFESRDGRKDQLKIGSWAASFRISRLTLVPHSN